MLRALGILAISSAIYGYTVGAAHCQLYATRNFVKFPLLILGTAGVCGLAYYIVGRFFGLELTLRRTHELAIDLYRDLSLLLVSLAPVNLFVALILVYTDDGRIGEYSLFLGMNVVFIAACGILALLRQGRRVLASGTVSPRRAAVIVLAWLALSMVVGGQGAFYLRPFFGYPASRGGHPPFALGTTPDVRGATNFFEAVGQVVSRPPLPESWGEEGE